MCFETTLLYTVCLHHGAATRTDGCALGGRCTPRRRRTELTIGWCPKCAKSLSGLFPQSGDLGSPSAIRRFWLWVSRQSPPPNLATAPVKEYMVSKVAASELNGATVATADEEWEAWMLNKVRGEGAHVLKLRKREWEDRGWEGVRKDVVKQAQKETLEWAEGYLLI
ncbi:hypothetical protein O9K51_01575 [Purpureocillium lavendulum]|uniref:Uncharacterized protein n=1 Tax=Purpureocillium lavendulum TaxID=1247861 RepID=A0AB34G5C4_9HYPO|nr:hypothetical protein O9K51_01575 [Purpureocillium lavendulum]